MGIRVQQTAGRRILRALAIVAIGVGLTYLVQFIELASVMFKVFSNINTTTDSARNQRGDEVMASTEASGRWQDPDRTVLQLRRAHHWFWTTLVETESFGIHENLKWRNEDALDVMLDFGCLTRASQPVEQVGSIKISYNFSDGNKALAKGCPD